MLLPTLALLLVVSLASGQGTSERPPYYSELEGSEVFDVAIIGCGPSGIQAALVAIQMNLSYVVLEKSDTCGDFFRNYPRRGDLISFNKPNVPIPLEGWDEDNAKDYALRFDWHSMLYGNLTFPPYTTKFYPRAETFVKYLNDVVAHNSINVRYHQEVQEISQRISPNGSGASGGGEVRDHFLADGSSVRSKTTLVATGLKLKPVHKNELKVYKHLFPNAAFFTYEDAPANECEAYTGKHIIIIGNGNAATELSSFIINECAAMRTWVLGKKSLRASHMTHYVGNVRTHNMVIMESYQLKSLDAHWEIPPFGDATEEDLQEVRRDEERIGGAVLAELVKPQGQACISLDQGRQFTSPAYISPVSLVVLTRRSPWSEGCGALRVARGQQMIARILWFQQRAIMLSLYSQEDFVPRMEFAC